MKVKVVSNNGKYKDIITVIKETIERVRKEENDNKFQELKNTNQVGNGCAATR